MTVFPYYRQINNYFCGPAVVQMMLALGGIRRSQHRLSRELKTTSQRGTAPSTMVRVLRSYGFRVSQLRNARLSDIEDALKANKPVLVDYIEPSDNEGHYAIVTNVNSRKVIMHDPWNGRNFSISRRRFVSRWRSGEGDWRRWMVTVARKD